MEYTKQEYEEDYKIAKKVFYRKFPFMGFYKDDFIQAAVIDLWRVKHKHNPEKSKYITFAFKVCYFAMLRCIRNEKKVLDNEMRDFEIGEDGLMFLDTIPFEEKSSEIFCKRN